jgi:hypothetical protein
VSSEMGRKAVNTNWLPASHSQQPMKSTFPVEGRYWMRTISGHVSNCQVRLILHCPPSMKPTGFENAENMYMLSTTKSISSTYGKCMATARLHLSHYEHTKPFFCRTCLMDEMWSHSCKPELKRQLNEWCHRSPKP